MWLPKLTSARLFLARNSIPYHNHHSALQLAIIATWPHVPCHFPSGLCVSPSREFASVRYAFCPQELYLPGTPWVWNFLMTAQISLPASPGSVSALVRSSASAHAVYTSNQFASHAATSGAVYRSRSSMIMLRVPLTCCILANISATRLWKALNATCGAFGVQVCPRRPWWNSWVAAPSMVYAIPLGARWASPWDRCAHCHRLTEGLGHTIR